MSSNHLQLYLFNQNIQGIKTLPIRCQLREHFVRRLKYTKKCINYLNYGRTNLCIQSTLKLHDLNIIASCLGVKTVCFQRAVVKLTKN